MSLNKFSVSIILSDGAIQGLGLSSGVQWKCECDWSAWTDSVIWIKFGYQWAKQLRHVPCMWRIGFTQPTIIFLLINWKFTNTEEQLKSYEFAKIIFMWHKKMGFLGYSYYFTGYLHFSFHQTKLIQVAVLILYISSKISYQTCATWVCAS